LRAENPNIEFESKKQATYEISEMILRGEVSENNTIKVELDGDKLTFKVE
jgi:hypothetical protein